MKEREYMQFFWIALAFLAIAIKTPILWLLYILFLPGYSILHIANVEKKEKAMFALPFSLLLVHWPYFLITRLGIGIPSEYFTLAPAIYIMLALYHHSKTKSIGAILKDINLNSDGRIKKDTLYTIILSAILLFAFYYSFEAFISPETYQPFQKDMRPGVPRTLGAKYIAETEMLKQNILSGRGDIGWSDKWFSGMHTFTSYSVLSYLILASDSLNTEVWKTHNMHVFLFSFLFALYLYYLLRHIDISKYIALTISIISAILPPLIQVNNVLKTSIDFTFLPLVLYGMLITLKKPDRTNTMLFAVTLSMFVLNFYLTMFILLYPLTIYALYSIYDSKDRITIILQLTKAGILALMIGGIWIIPFLHGSLTKTFSMMSYAEGGWHSPLKSIDEVLDYMRWPINPDNITFDLHSFTTFTPIFFYAGLISSIIIFIYSIREKNKNYQLAIIPIILLAYIMIQLTPLRDILPLYYAVYGKIYLYFALIPLFAISISQIISLIQKRVKYMQFIAAAIMIILFVPVFQYAHNMGTFLSEGSVVNEKNIEWLYRPLEQIGRGGSFIIFGLYGPGYIPGITQYADIQAFSGYGHESHSTTHAYEKRIVPFQEATMDYLLTDKASYAYNIFKQSNVRALAFQRCSYTANGQSVLDPNNAGGYAYETLSKDPRFIIIANDSCIALMTTANPAKVEKIQLSEMLVENPDSDHSENIKYATTHDHLDEMLNNREKAINSILAVPAGEHLHFTTEEFAYTKNRYTNIIINRTATEEEILSYLKNNSTVIYFRDDIKIDNPNYHSYKEYPKNETELNDILKDTRYIDTPVQFKQDKTNYEFNENGFILLKETYFRKWHANAEIKEDYLGFILADAKGQTKLWFGPTYIEYSGGLLTILGIIIIILIIIANKKESITKETHDPDEDKERQKKYQEISKKRRRKRNH